MSPAQRVAWALYFADRGYVLETGRVILEADNKTLRNDDRARQAYLGIQAARAADLTL